MTLANAIASLFNSADIQLIIQITGEAIYRVSAISYYPNPNTNPNPPNPNPNP